MGMTLLVHAFAAGLGLVLGSVALYATKGATLHRKSGVLFVYAMLTMALTGAAMAAFKANAGNMIAGALTAYLVITALTTGSPAHGRTAPPGGRGHADGVGPRVDEYHARVRRARESQGHEGRDPLSVMFYWLWRVRNRRTLRGVAGLSAPDAV